MVKKMITGINHVTFSVTDIDESFQFYSNILGFKPILKSTAGAYFLAGDTWLALTKDDMRRKEIHPEYSHVAFNVSQDDFKLMRERIISSGAEEWQKNSSEGDSHYFLDPDGHKLEIHSTDLNSRIKQAKAEWGPDVEWFV